MESDIRKLRKKKSSLQKYSEDPPVFEEFVDDQFGDYDTIRKKKPKPPQLLDWNEENDENDDRDFDFSGTPMRSSEFFAHQASPEIFSDSSERSTQSSTTTGLTESLDEDSDFDLQTELRPVALADRLKKPTVKKVPSRAALFKDPHEEDEDIGLGIGIDAMDLNRNTINKNIVFGTLKPPAKKTASLRPAASMNFSSNARTLSSAPSQETVRLRSAKSLWDLPGSKGPALCHRPLTVYTEPDRSRRSSPQKHRSPHKSNESLSNRRKRNIGLIRPAPGGAAQRKEINGMVFNPETGQWDGNEAELSNFDLVTTRKDMLLQDLDLLPNQNQSSAMVFDANNLCWVYRTPNEFDDPFQDIDDLPESSSHASTPNLRQSVMSTASSRREISSPSRTFMVPEQTLRLWKENDSRFMRKFGRWIEGDDYTAAARDLYKMVN